MDLFYEIIDNEAELERQLLVLVFVSLASIAIYLLFSPTDPEVPIDYSVPVPEQCSPDWKGRALEKPEIRASLYQSHYSR